MNPFFIRVSPKFNQPNGCPCASFNTLRRAEMEKKSFKSRTIETFPPKDI
jgi:hypothetical protein